MRALVLSLAPPLLALALAGPAPAQDAADRLAVIEAANALDAAVDAKDWDRALGLFAPTIVTELPGQEPAEGPAADLVGAWGASLHADKPSFHLRGGHVVAFDGPDRATVESKGYAWNRVEGLEGGDLWEVWGDYAYDLARDGDGWRITRFAFEPTHERGNTAVPAHQPEG